MEIETGSLFGIIKMEILIQKEIIKMMNGKENGYGIMKMEILT